MNYFPCTILAFVAVSSSLALPLDPTQLQQFIQQLQLQFPSSGGVAAQIPLPPFIQSLLSASGRSDTGVSEENSYNENITTILKACYNNGYYPSTYNQPRPLHNILTVGALGLGAGLLGSTLLGAIGRSDAEDILANLPSSQATGRTLDASQLPIPPFLQNIVQQVQSGNPVDTTNLPPFVTAFINQLQTGTLPPLLQNLVSLIQSSSSQQAAGRSDDVAADIEDIKSAEELLKACYSSNYSSGYSSYPYSSSYSSYPAYSYPGSLYTGGYTGGLTAGTGYPNIAIAPITGTTSTGGGAYPYNPYIYG